MKTSYTLHAVLLLMIASFIAGCKDDKDGPCGFPETSASRKITFEPGGYDLRLYSGTLLNNGENTLFYFYNGSRVTFFVGMNVPGICTENHFHPRFTVRTSISASIIPVKIYFEAYWSGLFPGETFVALDGVQDPIRNYSGSLECGLKQVFDDNPGNVDLYANFEFETQGGITDDHNTIMNLLDYIEISCTYDQDI